MTSDSADVGDKLKTIRGMWTTLPNALPAPPGGSWLDELESYTQNTLGLLKMHIRACQPVPQGDVTDSVSPSLIELDLLGECLQLLISEARQRNDQEGR
jgi:hypothetical protein